MGREGFYIIRGGRLNAEIVKPEQTSIARQRLDEHIPAATNTQAAIEELPFLCNGEVNTSVTKEELLGNVFSVDPPRNYITRISGS
jgi:hypothetical protein